MLNKTSLVVLLLLCCQSVFSQFKIDAQYRPRFEVRDGHRSLVTSGTEPAYFVSQRTRLTLSYKSENIRLVFAPQDVRVWGDEDLSSSTGVYGDNASLTLFEGYAELKTGNIGWLSVGRQQLVYDNERLLAARNWNQNGLAYDAVVYKAKIGEFDIHAGMSWNNVGEVISDHIYDPGRIQSLNYIWLNHTFTDQLKVSLSHIASGATQTDTTNQLYFKQTTGFYSEFKHDIISAKANFYLQFGKNNADQDVSSFLFDADVCAKTGIFQPGIGIGYVSGDNDLSDDKDHLFDVLYGARHRFMGHMDYFRNYPKHTKYGGLMDMYGYINVKASKNLTIFNTGHYFILAQTNQDTPDDKGLGYENELGCKYSINQWACLKGGYLMFFPTDNLRALLGVDAKDLQQFFFLELTIKPTLFQSNH